MESRICITGMGIISSVGLDKDSFWDGVKEKRNGFGNLDYDDLSEYAGIVAGQVKDFKLSDYVKTKGLRYYDRVMGFAAAAAQQIFDKEQYCVSKEDEAGIILGTSYGNAGSVHDFYEGALVDGPRYVNPMMFPRTMMTVPASQICINHKLKGYNRTFTNGNASGIDAICYAAELIANEEYKELFAGGAEALNMAILKKYFCSEKDTYGVPAGEGAALVLLESVENASTRNAKVYCEIAGWAQICNCGEGTEDEIYDTVKRCMEKAMIDSNVESKDIDAVFMQSVPGTMAYEAEKRAITDLLGRDDVELVNILRLTGNAMAASSAMQVCAGACMVKESEEKKVVMCNAYSVDASYVTVILKG